MGKARDSWQNFKKKHPTFENSKNFKIDLGPLLDKYEKQIVEAAKLAESVEKRLGALEKASEPVRTALNRYADIVAEVARSHGKSETMVFTTKGDVKKIVQSMQTDFDAFHKRVKSRSAATSKMMRDLARRSEKYEVEW